MNKFIFFYSPIYDYYKNHIIKNIGNFFDIESILIDDIPNKTNSWHTFCGGVSIKIELIIQKIKENLNSFIIFSDATIFINSNNATLLSNFFDSYKNNDLCFADNTGYGDHYNIGLILIKCNSNTLSFFENVLNDLIINKGWDQGVVNRHLYNTSLKIGVFDKEHIMCGDNFNQIYRDKYLIFKSFIGHTPNLITNYNSRLDKFHNAGLISDDEYNNNKK